jgi:hypothetical protein
VAFVASAATTIVLYVGSRGLGAGRWLGGAAALALGIALCLWLARRLPEDLDGLATSRRWVCAAWLLISILALAQTARVSAFMLDPAARQHSLFPGDPWYLAHSCLTAYAESARLAGQGEANIYASEHYFDRKLGSFNVDAYHYPPPFLLLPLALEALGSDDYPHLRMRWFALSALTLLLAMGAVAAALEPVSRRRAIAAIPAVWISMPVQVGFQLSNVQLLLVAVSALSWVAFRRWRPLGGALLALATVAKIFPGVLGLDLLLARRWKDALSTAAFGLILCGTIYAVVGPAPFRAFIDYEIPRLSSGEAFARPFSRDFAVAQNVSAFGIPLKLQKLGVPGMTFATGRLFSFFYGLTIVGLALWASRRTGVRSAALEGSHATREISVWLALISLGALASPFAPAGYVLASVVWLAALDRENFSPAFAAFVWLATSVPFLLPREGDFLVRALTYLPAQLFALGVPVYVLWRAGRRGAPATGVPAGG